MRERVTDEELKEWSDTDAPECIGESWEAMHLMARELVDARRRSTSDVSARARVRAVLDDRSGFHTDDLDAVTREDLLDAIVGAVLGTDKP